MTFKSLALMNLAIAVVQLCMSNLVVAQDESVGRPQAQEIEIALRISKQLVDDLLDDTIELSLPINRQVQGIPVRGSASGESRPQIEFIPSTTRAQFRLTLTGTAQATFSADAGPASAQSSSRATFSSRKQVTFDGKDFVQDSAQTEAINCTTIDAICSKRVGMVGRVVRCVANGMLARSKSEIDRAVNEITKEMIGGEFDSAGKLLVDELNQLDLFDESIEKYFSKGKSSQLHWRTTQDYLLVGIGSAVSQFPAFLTDQRMDALMEFWIRTRPVEELFINLLADWEVAHDLLKNFLPDEQAKAIAQDLRVETLDGWTVLQIGVGSSRGN